jgi:hypothetical protein
MAGVKRSLLPGVMGPASLAAFAALLPRSAAAGNTDSFYYSDDAAMTAGAVVATTRDAGAIWYNPAGLGGIRRGQVDLSGTTFAVRFRSVPSALRTFIPGANRTADLKASDFFSAPHTLTIIRKGDPKPKVVTLTRAVIQIQSVKYKVIEPGYAYIRVTQFQEHTPEKLAAAIDKLTEKFWPGIPAVPTMSAGSRSGVN